MCIRDRIISVSSIVHGNNRLKELFVKEFEGVPIVTLNHKFGNNSLVTFDNAKEMCIRDRNTPFAYHALKGVNLKITDQSFTAIIGQTGSGKSTLIQHINALLLPTSGSINIDEYLITATDKPSKLKPLRKKAGLVFQFPEYQLFEETIEKDIIFGPMNFGVSEEEAKKIAHNVLKTVGLDESYLNKSPFDLSRCV